MKPEQIQEWFFESDTESGICTTINGNKETRLFHRGNSEIKDIAEAWRSAVKGGFLQDVKESVGGRRLEGTMEGVGKFTADKFLVDDCGFVEDLKKDFPSDHYIHDLKSFE